MNFKRKIFDLENQLNDLHEKRVTAVKQQKYDLATELRDLEKFTQNDIKSMLVDIELYINQATETEENAFELQELRKLVEINATKHNEILKSE